MSVPLHKSTKELRAMSDEQLAQHMAYYKPGAPDYLLSEREFRRRQNLWSERRSWIALFLSGIAIVVSVFAVAMKM